MTTAKGSPRIRAAALALLVVGLVAGCGAAVSADSQRGAVSGSAAGTWQITVTVAGAPSTFDALYAFADNGVFIRVDGRNNGPGLGQWKAQGQNAVTLTFVVFQFDSTGKRTGTVTATAQGTVQGDKISGPFDATGVDLIGGMLAGFPKHGTFEGIRIKA